MQIEKRACSRLSVANNAYAALKLAVFKVGKIQNISMKGLMFSYIGLQVAPNTISEVDLFILHDSFYLPNIPCSVIYSAAGKVGNKSQSFIPFRCGLSFGTMKEQQKKHLEEFLIKNTNYKIQSCKG